MTRPTILDRDDVAVVPVEPTPEISNAFDNMDAWGNDPEWPTARDAMEAMLSASPHSSAWQEVREYVAGLEQENATAYELIGKTGLEPYIALKDRAEAAEARVKRLIEALGPFSARCNEAVRSDDMDNDGLTVRVGDLRRARAILKEIET